LTDEERTKLRSIMDKWGKIDSLSYFALRDDRSVIFNKSGKAALTYRVVGNVSLAAGDPLGDPEAWPGVIDLWLAEARSYGWIPAVLGASERATDVFHRAGMDALELGDEAIVHVADFTLEGREMRGIRQAVTRCERAGLTVVCTRLSDLSAENLDELRRRADDWRDGSVERGFSMALDRFGEERDGACVVVQTRDAEGNLVGLLNFVPWGMEGLSLDLMRRDPHTENGVMEFMVAELWKACPELGVKQLSLNFAVLRYVFARGERLGAGPVLRAWRGVLMWLSRFWQIESLYRANAKYRPDWQPRFLCFVNVGDLPTVATAALRAEAFLVTPTWLARLRRWSGKR
jgi:lysyl-tRNA synthetase class 2